MEWMAILPEAIAFFRLCLICCGIWMLLRSLLNQNSFVTPQKKCFALSGIIYLLGLMPQSLLLLLVNSDLVSLMLDNGYLCSTQKIACILAIALHTFICLNWIVEITRSNVTDQKEQANCLTMFLKHKIFPYMSVLYVVVIMMGRVFFLKNDEGKRSYTDVASRSGNNPFTAWTIEPVEEPTQVIRLQLLLCESTLSEDDMGHYLVVSYSHLLLPLIVLCLFLKAFMCKSSSELNSDKTEICDQEPQNEWQQWSWWEREENVQRLLSTAITVWYHLLQPIVFSFHRQHFVDFGTHLLLTICVFIPWTLSEKEQKISHSWV